MNINKKFIFVIYAILLAALVILSLNTFLNYLGIMAFERGDYEKARKYFSSFLVRNKEMIGKTFYMQNRFEEAFDYYKKAENVNGMGLAYLGLKNYEKAIEFFEKAGDNRGKGLALMGQKKYKEALELFEKADDKPGLGLAYMSMGDLDEAEEAFRDSGDFFGLGVVLLSKGDRSGARRAFEEAPSDTAKGIRYFLKGDLEKAKKYFSRKSDLAISGFFNYIIGNYDKAAEIFIYSKNDKKQGLLLMKQGNFNQAYEKFSSISDYENLGELFYRIKDYERAFEYFKKSGDFKRAFDCLMERGDEDRAIDFAKEVIRKEVSYPKLSFALAETYRVDGKYDFALEELDKLSKMSAYKSMASIFKARNYFYNKDFSGVSRELESLNGLYEDRIWKESVALSIKNNDEISGKQPVKVSPEADTEEKKEIEEEDNSNDESSGGFPWGIVLILLVLGAAGGGAWFVIKGKKPAIEERVSLIKTKNKKKKSKASEEETVNVAEILGLEEMAFDGISVLLNIMKKQGVKTKRNEIVELSGEGEDKLSVYGIYLASRAKGLAVKGIKIDMNYLKDVDSPVIVFFKDETFAHVVNFAGESLSLDFGLDKLVTVSQDKFLKIWNEYVMIFGVS